MKKILSALLCLTTILGLCACGSTGSSNAISMYDLNKAISEKADFQDMQYASSSDDNPESVFANISDLSYDKVQGFFVSYATDGTGNADEVAVIQVKKKNDLADATKSLEDHLSYRKSLYQTYDKSQLDKLDKAEIITKDDVVMLVVADDPETVKSAFYDFLK